MSIMRSFTTRRKQPELEAHIPVQLGRAASQRGGRPVARTQISAPVALVSTTNMLSYNAPNIAGTRPIEHRDLNSGSSGSSSEESDGSGGSVHSRETDPTDLSSAEGSPVTAEPEPNHLSQYFKTATPPNRSPSVNARPTMDSSPALPRRAPSHSKKAHEALSRKRSVQAARSQSVQGREVSRTRSSTDMFASVGTHFVEAPRENHISNDMAQLDAVAEEFGAVPSRSADAEDDALQLRTRGLARLGAADYLGEIDGLVAILLDDQSPTGPDFSGWF